MEPLQRRHPDAAAASVVSFDGDVVTKLHRPGTDPQKLTERLRVAARVDCLLSPLSTEPELAEGRWRTRWPRIEVVARDPRRLPWDDAGRVLAELHREPVGDLAIGHGAPDRLARALARLDTRPASDVIRRAAARLEFSGERRTAVHGDFHLGQLGWDGRRWVLIDIDDLGVGDPCWDLGRPAGYWAAGLIPDSDWHAFLDGYRAAGGPAVPAGDPWPRLEACARAAVIAAAAIDPDDELLIDACARMG
jgi:aminoglycoside phosphotransferase (APT) family kinase protein